MVDSINLAMVIRAARELCRINAEACNVDVDDKWALYSEEYKAEANAMLKAALAQPAGDAVAWVRMNDAGTGTTAVTDNPYYRDLWASEGSEVRPLYTAPPVAAGDARDAARWRALVGCGRVRVLGSAGLHSETDPYGNPHNGHAHIGLELWTKHEASSYPEAIADLTRFADKAVAALTQEQPNG